MHEPQAARRRRPPRPRLGRGGVVGGEQLGVNRRHRHEHARPGERVPDTGGLERHEPRLGARPQRAQQGHDQPVRVVQRQHVQQPIVAPPAPRLLQRRHRGRQRRVRQPDAFGSTGRAGGVEHQRISSGVRQRRLGAARRKRRQRPGAQCLRARRRRGETGQPGCERVAGHQHQGGRVPHHVCKLGRRVQRRQRYRQPAGAPDCEQRFDVGHTRLDQKRHRPPATNTLRDERVRGGRGSARQRAVARFVSVTADHRDRFRRMSGQADQQGRQTHMQRPNTPAGTLSHGPPAALD